MRRAPVERKLGAQLLGTNATREIPYSQVTFQWRGVELDPKAVGKLDELDGARAFGHLAGDEFLTCLPG